MTSDPDSRGLGADPDGAGVDVAVVGAGAAGLMAAIQTARGAPGARVVALDGARTLGAKILVAGGGRCNVTHREVRKDDFCGSRPNAIGKVLKAFGVPDTIAFFRRSFIALLALVLVVVEGALVTDVGTAAAYSAVVALEPLRTAAPFDPLGLEATLAHFQVAQPLRIAFDGLACLVVAFQGELFLWFTRWVRRRAEARAAA